MRKKAQSAFNVDQEEIIVETGDVIAWELKNRKKKVVDDKPVHFSNAILQTSKLLFLRFMYWLYKHLEPGSFRTCYADTDSMCLALTKTDHTAMHIDTESFYRGLFDPIVKSNMRQSWESTWKDWFVTTDDVHDKRKPGKLKGQSI